MWEEKLHFSAGRQGKEWVRVHPHLVVRLDRKYDLQLSSANILHLGQDVSHNTIMTAVSRSPGSTFPRGETSWQGV